MRKSKKTGIFFERTKNAEGKYQNPAGNACLFAADICL